MLQLTNLHAGILNKEILHGIDLTIRSGEIHAIMGPNGSGKTTLAMTLMGHPNYNIKSKMENFKFELINSSPSMAMHAVIRIYIDSRVIISSNHEDIVIQRNVGINTNNGRIAASHCHVNWAPPGKLISGKV